MRKLRSFVLVGACVLASAGCGRSHGVSDVIVGSEQACRFHGAVDMTHVELRFAEGTLVMTWLPESGSVASAYFGSDREPDESISAYRSRLEVDGAAVSPTATVDVVEEDSSGGGLLQVIGEVEVQTLEGARLLRFESRAVRLFASCGS